MTSAVWQPGQRVATIKALDDDSEIRSSPISSRAPLQAEVSSKKDTQNIR